MIIDISRSRSRSGNVEANAEPLGLPNRVMGRSAAVMHLSFAIPVVLG